MLNLQAKLLLTPQEMDSLPLTLDQAEKINCVKNRILLVSYIANLYDVRESNQSLVDSIQYYTDRWFKEKCNKTATAKLVMSDLDLMSLKLDQICLS